MLECMVIFSFKILDDYIKCKCLPQLPIYLFILKQWKILVVFEIKSHFILIVYLEVTLQTKSEWVKLITL